MFRIRRVFDDALPIDQQEIAQIEQTLRAQFPGIREQDVVSLPAKLRSPLKYKFRHLLFVADDAKGVVRGFALVAHDPQLRFFFLDYIATGQKLSGSGVGGALYERLRHEAVAHGVVGIFFECLPDDPAECESREQYRQNVARLRFYERYGVRPIINTAYQKPVEPDERGSPYLLFDGLGGAKPLRRETVRAACRAILERKYDYLCSPEYVDEVVASFRDDPVRFREPRYVPPKSPAERPFQRAAHERALLVVNDKHDIHHIRERGYVEAPVRIAAILKELEPTGLFRTSKVKEFPEAHIRAVHDGRFVDYLKRACQNVPAGKSLYPYVFPIRNTTRPPKELSVRAGYYCIDTFTPLNQNAFPAAKRAVDCALTAAEALLGGERLAYALVRPPGHHAEYAAFGGFCYFNNCAVAAHHLSRTGPVAIVDIDYHHGNGQQEIFYERGDVLTVSIHGHPGFAYPYFSGFEDERGAKSGNGYNLNIPLPEQIDAERYRQSLTRALDRVRHFGPRFLVVALGLDTAKADPTGTWSLVARDFEENGRLIGSLRLPTLVVQEGGYRTRTLGINARYFFTGLVQATFGPPANGHAVAKPAARENRK
ncbi:MAG: histone deacetylase family protein [Planctomycetes bacterium]|nr:histone deacetylase family protein [Planctomycetota bacterium]